MTDIDSLLAKARSKAEDYGRLRGRKETADDRLKGVMASLREDAPDGSVPDKEAWVRRQPEYKKAVEDKENAFADWETASIYIKILFAEVAVWQSKQANDRQMDRLHT